MKVKAEVRLTIELDVSGSYRDSALKEILADKVQYLLRESLFDDDNNRQFFTSEVEVNNIQIERANG